ncbi:MAG: sulfatase [Deltaproteobacteria bacterium]|nr:sulfatase [Deltaproteobacteria bacterium]NND30574.1 sulfatase-like hydrolase/transferase [Myxococcales bacterium]MBT8464640.1 sulfatase [Deltaproteobacteria bacterium]MBT8480927.1 sulfatase [Deltaproteobacteria bacterium]NNK08394.1 sulfatase-like hydrolase/transferase [Myxococcales bacterium]
MWGRHTKAQWALLVLLCLQGYTCEQDAAGTAAQTEEAAERDGQPARPKRSTAPAVAPAPDGTAQHQDLLALLHLADVYDQAGLFADFGTAARPKYTIGNWNSGWLGESREGEARVSTFGKTARLYLPAAKKKAMQLRLRAKPYASGALIVYVNGKTAGEARVAQGDGFRELLIPIPVAQLRAGENSIMLRATKSAQVRGKARSMAIDWLRFEPKGAEAPAAPGRVELSQVPVAGVERRAIVLAPGAQVDWFVEAPDDGSLVFGSGPASGENGSLSLLVSTDRSEGSARRMELGPAWSDQAVSLSSHAGAIVRLRFRNEGTSDLGLSDVRIVRRAGEPVAMQEPARNVIVLLIDTLRSSKVRAYYPKTRVKTPVLDEFAAKGTLFERSQSPENWTKPSVASVLTSLHPATHRTKQDASKLPKSALMLSEVYKKAGFKTASFIANGYVSNAFGFDQGWDHYTNYIREARNTNASNVFGEAQSWIEKHKEGRFFVYIQTIDPHVPYDPPAKFLKMYDAQPYSGQVQNRRTHLMLDEAKKNPKKYAFTKRDKERIEALHDGEISYHDEYFGKFLVKLRELGLEENTIVVVTSDHGEEFQEHGSWGHGHSVYQELLGVPLMFRWPGVVRAGERIAPVVSTMDIGPTVLEATGVAIPDVFEGRSLLGFMRGDWPAGPYVAFSDFLDHRRVIRGGDWKMIIRGNLTQVMFDLGNDYWEKRELDGTQHPIAQRYLRTLHGQFLGAKDRGRWLAASSGSTAKKGPGLAEEKQDMTPELCRQLVALGYISAECDALLKN